MANRFHYTLDPGYASILYPGWDRVNLELLLARSLAQTKNIAILTSKPIYFPISSQACTSGINEFGSPQGRPRHRSRQHIARVARWAKASLTKTEQTGSDYTSEPVRLLESRMPRGASVVYTVMNGAPHT